jgi:DNA-binding NarL/FixJ family response regulator
VELDEETLRIRERVLGPEHPDTLSSRHNLAGDYYHLRRYQRTGELDSEPSGVGHSPSFLSTSPSDMDREELSPQEVEILLRLVNFKAINEIAKELSIHADDVTEHMKFIMAKTGAISRDDLTAYARKHGMVE